MVHLGRRRGGPVSRARTAHTALGQKMSSAPPWRTVNSLTRSALVLFRSSRLDTTPPSPPSIPHHLAIVCGENDSLWLVLDTRRVQVYLSGHMKFHQSWSSSQHHTTADSSLITEIIIIVNLLLLLLLKLPD